MVDYCPGDSIVCKVGAGEIKVAGSSVFDELITFDILCLCGKGFLILVPSRIYLHKSFVLNQQDCREFGLADKFRGGLAYLIDEYEIVALKARMSGLSCAKCGEHCPHSDQPNRISADGKAIYICYLCRFNKYR